MTLEEFPFINLLEYPPKFANMLKVSVSPEEGITLRTGHKAEERERPYIQGVAFR